MSSGSNPDIPAKLNLKNIEKNNLTKIINYKIKKEGFLYLLFLFYNQIKYKH
ncbi:hypothetical protein OC709_01815 ['Planchonia careya' phytoplasma]|nr:hypothetical protein ['Planchonia careya' phytoplasma]MDO8030244.1 hypothetical protein ['Planchonia careya' phytoplasma]